MKNLQIMEEYYSNGVVFHLYGEINIQTTEKLKSHFNYFIRKEQKEFLLEFGKVFYIDSSGLSFLRHYDLLLKEKGGHLWLSKPRPEILKIFEMVKLKNIFQFVDSVHDVMRYFEKKTEKASNRILLISSDVTISEKILFALREKGYNYTDHVESSKQAKLIIETGYDVIIYDMDIEEEEPIVEFFMDNKIKIPLILTSYKIKKKILDENISNGLFMDKDIVGDADAVSSLVSGALNGSLANENDILINYSSIKSNFADSEKKFSGIFSIFSDVLDNLDTYVILFDSNQKVLTYSKDLLNIFPYIRENVFFCDTGISEYILEYSKEFFKGKDFHGSFNYNGKKYSIKGVVIRQDNNKYYSLYIQDENTIHSDRNN